jgi:chromosome segregation ATPase
VSRLESVNIKLRKEKIDLVKEISSIKQEAHQEILKAEAALNHKIQGLESQAKELKEQLETTHKALNEASTELAAAQETMKQDAGTIAQVLNTYPVLHTNTRKCLRRAVFL